MPELPLLYSFRRCPYAMRARFALVYSGIACHLREVHLKHKPPSLLDISPKGTVPVLVLPDGTVIDESLDIIAYALTYHDPDGLATQAPKEAAALIARNDNEFTPILRRYKYHERYLQESKEDYLKQAETLFIEPLEERLARHAYLTGNAISVADVAIFPFIRQFAMAGQGWFDRCPYAHLRRWLQGFLDHPLFERIMVKHAPWREGDKVTLLLC